MKNKTIIFGMLAASLIIAGGVYAAGQGNNAGATNQNSPVQIQAQTATQSENGTVVQAGAQVQQQERQQLQDGSEAGGQVQEQNQVRAVMAEDVNGDGQVGQVNGNQRRSQVANAVQVMLQVADRDTGIGEQVRAIAQTQTQNQDRLEVSLDKVQSRNAFTKFFIGPNYGEINNVKRNLEQNREQVRLLNQLNTQVANQGDQQQLMEQVRVLEQANAEIESSLGVVENGFSLLGWMFRLFAK